MRLRSDETYCGQATQISKQVVLQREFDTAIALIFSYKSGLSFLFSPQLSSWGNRTSRKL